MPGRRTARRQITPVGGAWCATHGIVLLLLVSLVLVACESAPRSAMPNESSSTEIRQPKDPMHWATYARQPMADRTTGVEQLLAEDPDRFWQEAAIKARQIDDWPMIRLLCDKAQATSERRALPWLVQSWAMRSVTVEDTQRPERLAIATITGLPAEAWLAAIVLDPEAAEPLVTQVAAWTVLCRVETGERLRELVLSSPQVGNDSILEVLRQVAPAVDMLPADRLAIAHAAMLLEAYPDARWEAWALWREAATRDKPATLALRHLPALERRDTLRDNWTRQQWSEQIEARLAGRRHAFRGASGDEAVITRTRSERLADQIEQLGIADLLVVDRVLDAMDSPSVRRAVFEQADADRLDTTSELGGALGWDDTGQIVYRDFPPMFRRHDQAYIASSRCMEAVYLGLAHVHFHAQRYDNAAWAGPGQGDLDFVDTHHVNAVVFTFLDSKSLNVDLYMPGGIILDLGCMTR